MSNLIEVNDYNTLHSWGGLREPGFLSGYPVSYVNDRNTVCRDLLAAS